MTDDGAALSIIISLVGEQRFQLMLIIPLLLVDVLHFCRILLFVTATFGDANASLAFFGDACAGRACGCGLGGPIVAIAVFVAVAAAIVVILIIVGVLPLTLPQLLMM